MNKAFLETILRYERETGALYWLASHQRPDRIGERAGWFDTSVGYWKIALGPNTYLAAKVIWCLAYDEWLENNPDHKDLDRGNDRLDNLRKTTKSLNAANSSLNSRNTVGLKGVSYCSATGRYRASIQVDRKSINLGRYDTAEEAHEAYIAAAIDAFGEFARAS